MSADNAITPLDDGAGLAEHPGDSLEAHHQEPTPLRKGLMIMRGRWPWAIGLGLILAALGGTLGYTLPQPTYRSEGLIGIQPYLPRVMYQTEQNEMMPMLGGFIDRQVRQLTQQRVIQQVLRNDEWQALGDARGSADSLAGFASRLNAEHPRNSQLISVTFDHSNPEVAQTAVKLVIEAYEQVYRENNTKEMSERMRRLRQRRDNLQSELNSLRQRRLDLASEYGTDDLSQVYRVKLEEVNRLESELDRLRLRLTKAGLSPEKVLEAEGGTDDTGGAENSASGSEGEAASEEAPAIDPAELTVDQIAARDQRMQRYLEQRDALERELRKQRLSLGENHRKVQETRSMLSSIEGTIQQRAEDFRQNYAENMNARGGSDTPEQQLSTEQLKQRYRNLHVLHQQAKQEAAELGNQRLQLESLKQQEEDLRERLTKTEQRLEELEVEGQFIRERTSGRVKVLSYGSEPLRPHNDRRKLGTFAGVTFGGGAGVGLILLIGLLDPRMRNLEEAEDSLQRVSVLGILPTLPRNPTDPEQALIAAHSVHQVRTLLQIGPEADAGRVYSVTSPIAGDGKTSLTLALGMSFATSGARTLLIDCDLFQGGLSQRIMSEQNIRICQALRREGRVSDRQLQHALGRANSEEEDLGRVLIDTGAISEAELQAMMPERSLGLIDVLDGQPIDACAVSVGLRNLWLLPGGMTEEQDSARLSPGTLRSLFDTARQAFDVVLVDTGPVPGSLEATQAAVNADGVVMMISRGGTRAQAERAVEHLETVGAHLSGVVFNRAGEEDLQRLAYSTDAVARSAGPSGGRSGSGHTEGSAAIARAVAGAGVDVSNGTGNEHADRA